MLPQDSCSEARSGSKVRSQCITLCPCTRSCIGMAAGGIEARARSMFGSTNDGLWSDNDKETYTGMRMGYKSGAGSKVCGISKDKNLESRRRPCRFRGYIA